MAATRNPPPAPEVRAYLAAVREPRAGHPYVALLGMKAFDTASVHARVQEGLSFTAMEKLRKAMALPAAAVAGLLSIPTRTLQRRREEGRLQPDESDRLVRLSRVYGRTLELFEGHQDAANAWLQTSLPALAGATPLDLIQSEPGVQEVESLIGRLEHGVVV